MSPPPTILGVPSDLCELTEVSSKSIVNYIFNIFPEGLYNIGLKYKNNFKIIKKKFKLKINNILK